MKKNKKGWKILSAALAGAAAACLGVGLTFAYFSSNEIPLTGTLTTEIGTTDTSDYIVKVSDFKSLYTACQRETYNDGSEYSALSSTTTTTTTYRKVVTFKEDITLENDLWVTADVHFDLKTYTLNLNGYTLTIQHTYDGTFGISNGKITTTYTTTTGGTTSTTTCEYNGGIVVDTPNASVLFKSVVYYDGATGKYSETPVSYSDTTGKTTNCDYVIINTCVERKNTDYGAYAALYAVGTALATDLDRKPERLTYAEFSALKNTTDNTDTRYAATNFLSQKTCCSTGTACTYVAVGCDLDLPTHYLSDYTIGYTVTNTDTTSGTEGTAILSELGNALSTGVVTLTAKVKKGGTAVTGAEATFTVHVVDEGTTAIAKTLIESYLLQYRQITTETTTTNDGKETEKTITTYVFGNAFQLPTGDADLGITLSYELDGGDETVDDKTDSTGKTVIIYPTTQSTTLKATVTVGGSEDTFTLIVYSSYMPTTEAIAELIVSQLYGGAVIYDFDNQYAELYEKGDLEKNYPDLYNTAKDIYNLTSITYEVVDGRSSDTDDDGSALDYYEKTTITNDDGSSDERLTLKEDAGTPKSKAKNVECTVTFGDNDSHTIALPVWYVTDAGGTTASSFLIAYNVVDNVVPTETYTSFALDYNISGTSYYVVYDFAYKYGSGKTTGYAGTATEPTEYDYYGDSETDDDGNTTVSATLKPGAPEAISLVLATGVVTDDDGTTILNESDVYNDDGTIKYSAYETKVTFTYDGTNTMQKQFADWLASSSYNTTYLETAGAKWIVKIDQSKLDVSDEEILILYNYTQEKNTKEPTWKKYTQEIKATADAASGTSYYTPSTVTGFTLQGGVYLESTYYEVNISMDNVASSAATVNSTLTATTIIISDNTGSYTVYYDSENKKYYVAKEKTTTTYYEVTSDGKYATDSTTGNKVTLTSVSGEIYYPDETDTTKTVTTSDGYIVYYDSTSKKYYVTVTVDSTTTYYQVTSDGKYATNDTTSEKVTLDSVSGSEETAVTTSDKYTVYYDSSQEKYYVIVESKTTEYYEATLNVAESETTTISAEDIVGKTVSDTGVDYTYTDTTNNVTYTYTYNVYSYEVTETTDGTTTTTTKYYIVKVGTNNGVVKDTNLFAWLRATYVGSDSTATFVPSSSLGQSKTMDVTSDSTLKLVEWASSGIADVLPYMTGLTEANLSGIAISADMVSTLNKMTALQKLTLQNCGLTDTIIKNLSSGGELANLRVLDVSSNSIMGFDWLTKTNFAALEEAYIYGNESDNDYQGSGGMSNFQTFEDLTDEGVTVYNTLNAYSQPVAFENSDENSDYARLKSLVYQSTISGEVGTDFSSVYEKFTEISATSFGLSDSYKLTWSDNHLTAKTDGKEYFQVTASIKISDATYEIVAKYYVYRKAGATTSTSS